MQHFSNEDQRIALKKFESMLKSNKVFFFDSTEFEEIVYHYMDSGKINLANKAVELSLSQHPSSVRLKLIKVELLIFENELNQAEKLILSLENLEPTYDEIYIQKSAILSKKNLHLEAINVLKIALKYTSDLVDVHSLIGMEYLFVENFEAAIKHFKICLVIDKDDFTALYNIIYCFDMDEKHLKATEFLNDFINENPYCEIAWHQLGRQYLFLNKHNEAIRAFDYAILIDEYFVGAYLEKAKALEEQNKYEEAISNYLMTLKLDDPTAFTYLQIANCFKEIGNIKKAIHYYFKATQEDPMMEQAWMLLTRTYLEEGNTQKALFFIQKALEVDPNNTIFLNQFAEVNIKLNLFEEAAKAFQKSIELGEINLEIYLALTDVLNFIGDYDDSFENMSNALIKFGDLAEIMYRLSGIYFLLRNDKEGLICLETSLKIDLDYFYVVKELFPVVFEKDCVKKLIEKFN